MNYKNFDEVYDIEVEPISGIPAALEYLEIKPALYSMFHANFGEIPSTYSDLDVSITPLINSLKKIGKVSVAWAFYRGEQAFIPSEAILSVETRKRVGREAAKVFITIRGMKLVNKNKLPSKHSNDCFPSESLKSYVPVGKASIHYSIANSVVASDIAAIASSCRLDKLKSKPHINMIVQTSMGLDTAEVNIDTNYSLDDLDLHYGDGFSTFHNALINRIANTDKGIVMFHGSPGTGKTHYIRRLISQLNQCDKKVILIPKHIFSALETPAFNDFMLENFAGKKIVFIIEDAEAIIAKRKSDDSIRSELVSTLLNMTDGILNDILNIQVILTFNTDLSRIDEALLRKGRLIARHEFLYLDKNEAEKLAKHIGVSLFENKTSYSVADIYSYAEKDECDILVNNKLKERANFAF